MYLETLFGKGKRKGQALILCYMVITAFLIYASSLFTTAISENNISLRKELSAEAFYMAEGATESAIAAFSSAIANFQIATDTATFSTSSTYATFGNAIVNTVISSLEPSDRLVTEGETNIYVRNYEAVSSVTHPDNSEVTVTVHQIFARRLIPTFQHAVFYNQDLEVLPGPNMTLSGRIHSNEDIYLASNNTLTIDSFYLHSAGEIFNKRKDSSALPPGDVSIREDKPGAPNYELMNGLDSDSANWTSEAITRWGGTVQSAVHGVTKLTAPSIGSIQTGGYYHSNADVKIINNTLTKGGVALVEGVDYPAGTITSTTSFYNNRENATVKMTVIDLEKLAGQSGTCGGGSCPNNLPSNGLLYATRDDAIGGDQPGIKLINGSQIYRNGGLTFVSNDPVYLQGDYNTVSEKPTSIICDALNLLSNDWVDNDSYLGVDARVASDTTFNAALITGIDVTATGSYNGGLENYPRLHEKWSGKDLTIKGSFVALWESAVAQGAWQYGNPQYKAPQRYFSYNLAFNDPNNLPPFTPMAVEAKRLAWWSE